ncbi:MAG: hypothetical protein LQ346_004100 [Caloplaca aetnensis]|nr:MAG: hypothetical protein LQ346_004100 [Caloplaca aetnensis]
MDKPVNVPIDNPDADTEWNDILRKHGIIPEKPPSPTSLIEEALAEARKQAHDNRLEGKGLDELDELEDEEDAEFLESYRKQRMAELSTISRASVFNQVYPLQKPDYSRDVTDASRKAYVLVHLTASLGTNVESRLLTELWREMARKYGDIKFCEMKGDMCIEGYPDKNTPTILIYHEGDIRRQVITLRELAGSKTGIKDLENLLIEVGALNANDSRLTDSSSRNGSSVFASRQSVPTAASTQDDEDDWD